MHRCEFLVVVNDIQHNEIARTYFIVIKIKLYIFCLKQSIWADNFISKNKWGRTNVYLIVLINTNRSMKCSMLEKLSQNFLIIIPLTMAISHAKVRSKIRLILASNQAVCHYVRPTFPFYANLNQLTFFGNNHYSPSYS